MGSIAAVVPCYNGEQYLAEALGSIRAQTRPADEVIVVDDGSTDGSAALAGDLGAVVVRQANLGEGAARNAGLRAATTDLVAWLDADDRWRPQHLEVVGGLLEREPAAVAAFGAVQQFGTRAERLVGYVPLGAPSSCINEAFGDWLHTTIASITRRTALLELGGFDVTERYAVDFDLWLRLARRHRFVATHEVTSEWRWHSAQQSAQFHLQLAAVYRSRRRFLNQLRADGDDALADVLEGRLAELWVRDVKAAARHRDGESIRQLRTIAPTIPTLSAGDRFVWSTASHVPVLIRRGGDVRRLIRGRSRS